MTDQWGLVGARTKFKNLPKDSLRIPRPGDAALKTEAKNDVMTSPEAIKSFFG